MIGHIEVGFLIRSEASLFRPVSMVVGVLLSIMSGRSSMSSAKESSDKRESVFSTLCTVMPKRAAPELLDSYLSKAC